MLIFTKYVCGGCDISQLVPLNINISEVNHICYCFFRSWRRWTWSRKWASGSCTKVFWVFFSSYYIPFFFLIINYASTCQLMPGHNLIQLVSWAAAAAVAHTLSEPALGRSSCRRCRVPAPLTKGNVLCLGLFSAVSLCVGSIRIVWYWWYNSGMMGNFNDVAVQPI